MVAFVLMLLLHQTY